MKKKKLFYLICFFAFSFIQLSYAESDKNSCKDELEKSLSSFLSKDNLRNADDFTVLSVTCLGKIKTDDEIVMYADTLTQPFSVGSASSSSMEQRNEIRTSWQEIKPQTMADMFNQIKRDDLIKAAEYIQNQLLMMRKNIIETLKVGNQAFSIKFKYKEREFETFVFYDDSCKLVYDQVFLNFRQKPM